MAGKGSQGTSYGVFVRFRRSRLPLRRGIARLEDAFALAEELRAERPHKRDEVFVARESDGAVMLVGVPAPPAARAEAAGDARATLRAALDRARGAERRAVAAIARLDAVVSTFGEALDRDAGPPALRESHARTRAAFELSARTIASFIEARQTMEAWMERTQVGRTRDPEPPAPPEV